MSVYSNRIIQKARKLRKQNFSYREIGKILNVPDTAVGRWCFKIKAGKGHFLREIKRNQKIRREITKKERAFIKAKANKINQGEAKLLAALLYWCEGSKYPTASRVDFVNSDERMMKTFIFLLRKGFNLNEKKFRVHLQIHDTHNFEKIKQLWSKLLGIPEKQFLKPTITKPTGKRHRDNYNGTCTLRYHDYRISLRLIAIYENLALIITD